ncbi:MAG: ADP-ribose-binding protein [Chlamydiales bacterium]
MQFGSLSVVLKKGDITQETVDVIVNAANSSLMGGGGVDGAIHRVGGLSILEECEKIRQERGRCSTGEAVITNAGNLKAKKVVHAVGPIWHGGDFHEPELLRSAYLSSLKLAHKAGATTVAFPSISTGAYGYPVEQAALIAIEAIKDFSKDNQGIKEVRFILFSDHDYLVYEEALKAIAP